MLPRRVESQIRWDWDLIPAVWSLCFASKVNLSTSLAIQRFLKKNETHDSNEAELQRTAAKIYELLWNGEYMRPDGTRAKIAGDTTKILQAIGLNDVQRSLIHNYQFMSSKIPGTRQIRRTINHIVFSSRVVYGLPVFMTVTPSERHSGLMIRLTRYRRNDPGLLFAHKDLQP